MATRSPLFFLQALRTSTAIKEEEEKKRQCLHSNIVAQYENMFVFDMKKLEVADYIGV